MSARAGVVLALLLVAVMCADAGVLASAESVDMGDSAISLFSIFAVGLPPGTHFVKSFSSPFAMASAYDLQR